MTTTQEPNENGARDRTENRNEIIDQTAIQTEVQNESEVLNENDIQDENEFQDFMTEVPVTVENTMSITPPKPKSNLAKIMIRIRNFLRKYSSCLTKLLILVSVLCILIICLMYQYIQAQEMKYNVLESEYIQCQNSELLREKNYERQEEDGNVKINFCRLICGENKCIR